MLAEESLRKGNLEEALTHLQDQVRKDPDDVRLRVFLFQLLSVLGRWDRALKQLEVCGDLDPDTLPMVRTYEPALRCEALRAEVFKGERSPLFFGEPEEWMAYLLSALKLVAKGEFAQAAEVRDRAFEAAPATTGKIDGQPFEWIADADTRLGPMLEAIVNGRYQWIPFSRLRQIEIEAPSDLRDLVWTPATLRLSTDAEVVALIPTRYPGSEASPDHEIQRAKRTDLEEKAANTYVGLGQRLLSTDAGDYPLLEVREIQLDVGLSDG
jgi:type VI secretion system protein ImpE